MRPLLIVLILSCFEAKSEKNLVPQAGIPARQSPEATADGRRGTDILE